MKTHIGQIVLTNRPLSATQPTPAVVTRLNDDGTVNLRLLKDPHSPSGNDGLCDVPFLEGSIGQDGFPVKPERGVAPTAYWDVHRLPDAPAAEGDAAQATTATEATT